MISVIWEKIIILTTSPVAQLGNNPPTRDTVLIHGSGRSPGEGNGKPLQYSCLDNPMDRGVWQATIHGVAKSQAQLSVHTDTIILMVTFEQLEY